jgi:hypothetical protein
VENLECDHALVLGVLREADRCHPTATELAVDCIGRSEELPDALDLQRQAEGWRLPSNLPQKKEPGIVPSSFFWSGGRLLSRLEYVDSVSP